MRFPTFWTTSGPRARSLSLSKFDKAKLKAARKKKIKQQRRRNARSALKEKKEKSRSGCQDGAEAEKLGADKADEWAAIATALRAEGMIYKRTGARGKALFLKTAKRAMRARFFCPGKSCKVCPVMTPSAVDGCGGGGEPIKCTKFAENLVQVEELEPSALSQAVHAMVRAVRAGKGKDHLELVGADRNVDAIVCVGTKGDKVYSFVLRSDTVVNWAGGTRAGSRPVPPRRDADGNVLRQADKMLAARVSRASRSQRFVRTAGDVVGLQLQAIADFCVGLPFKPGKLEDAELIWSVGNASFSHARKGGPTFIGAKGLLSATARVAEQSGFESQAVSVLEDMSSQLCPSCTRFITRPDGDYKRAACTDCEMSVHRDVSSAANMLRILAYRIVHGERETCYKRRTKSQQTGEFERLPDPKFYAKYEYDDSPPELVVDDHIQVQD